MTDCTLTNFFGQFIQVLLAFMVLIVLSIEYFVDLVRSKFSNNDPKRDVIQFWFDVFKISCGAALSHLFNVLISMYLSTNGDGGDECALYALAFVYEGSGVPFVQLLTYCVIRYAETVPINSSLSSSFWGAVSRPGEYNHNVKTIKKELEFKNPKFWRTTCFSLVPSLMCLLLGLKLGWSSLVTFVGPIFGFMFFFTFFYTTWDATYQVLAWCAIKLFEKGIWTGFVVAQSSYFEDWSTLMELHNAHVEAIYYVCLIPIAMNAFMFFMFSRISRLQLPCLNVKARKKSNSDKRRFDVNEGLKVGVIFCLMMNSLLWLACSLAFRNAEVVLVLLISMVILPFVMCSLLLFMGYYIVNWRYAKSYCPSKVCDGNAVPLIPSDNSEICLKSKSSSN